MFTAIIHATVTLFAVMNPLGNVPIFITLTDGTTVKEQRQTAKKAMMVSFVILLVFLLFGKFVLNFFGITISAFRVAGGILIFGIAYHLLHANKTPMHSLNANEHQESLEKEDISVTPLATPIIAGPGTIATVMALAADGKGIIGMLPVFIGFVVVLILTYFIFHYAAWITKRLGETELNVITRLMGLILAVIAVQMAVSGLQDIFPGWTR